MYPALNNYLEEISHYLAIQRGTEEILEEIRSHIMEKTSQESGNLSEETILKAIADYGSPRQVAERYIEGETLIAPTLKKFLLHYTLLLFSLHVVLTLFALVFNTRIILFPFIYIPQFQSAADLFYLPTALVYDLGLVGLFLYLVTQHGKELRLPWFNFHVAMPDRKEAETEEPNVYLLAFMLAGYGAVVAVYLRYQTLFIKGVNSEGVQSLFGVPTSHLLSLAVLAFLALEIGRYAVTFYTRSEWAEVVKNLLCLALAGVVNLFPLSAESTRFPFFSERTFGTILVIYLTISCSYALFKSLYRIGKGYLGKGWKRT
jgi:hypothetical protein